MPSSRRSTGFTLVELVIVITVLGILAAVAAPKFFDFTSDGKEAACRGALGAVRTTIASTHAYRATPSGGGTASFPSLVELQDGARTLFDASLPDNPYSTAKVKNAVVRGTTPGTPVTSGTAGGWCYKPSTGEFWADTQSGAGESGW